MIHLEIVTPKGTYRNLDVKSVHLKTSLGEMTILPSHMPIISDIVPCDLRITLENGETQDYALSTGFMRFEKDDMTILADAVEGKGEIDLERAQAAYKRARERLDKKDPDTNMKRAQLSLMRAINRINLHDMK